MILQKVEHRTRRAFSRVVEAPKPVDKPRTTVKAIYSRKLGKNLYPYRDPKTGRVSAVMTEDGDILREADIEAFRLID
jgi:hypothetical protein